MSDVLQVYGVTIDRDDCTVWSIATIGPPDAKALAVALAGSVPPEICTGLLLTALRLPCNASPNETESVDTELTVGSRVVGAVTVSPPIPAYKMPGKRGRKAKAATA